MFCENCNDKLRSIHYPCKHKICGKCFANKPNKFQCNICNKLFSYIEILFQTLGDDLFLHDQYYQCYLVLYKNMEEQKEINQYIKELIVSHGGIVTSRSTNPWNIDAQWNDGHSIGIYCLNEEHDNCSMAARYIIPNETVSKKFTEKKYHDCRQRMPSDWECSILTLDSICQNGKINIEI